MLGFIVSIVSAVFLLVAILVFANRKPGYSHLRHTISELGEVGAPDQRLVGFGVFLPVGLMLLFVGYSFRLTHELTTLLSVCIGAGYLGAAFFPCDPGSPLTGTMRQTIHNIGGAVEYFGGFVALMRISESWGVGFQIAGFIVGGTGFALSIPALAPVRGLIQRVAELCLFGGLILAIGLEYGVF
ncbi:MAG: hypothetical protein Fur0022_21440 [Anaerolineales bacterium]